MNDHTIIPTLEIVSKLIFEQFPEFAHLAIKPVSIQGHDNHTFHLGDDMLVRLPSAAEYAEQVQKEQKWLPFLAQHLSTPIPSPIALGKPSEIFPWHWSIYRWLDGESANTIEFTDLELEQLAISLAGFLNELHKIETTGAPIPGSHNFYRGAHIEVYDADARNYLSALKGVINQEKAIDLWERAINTKWDKVPVWIHGDFASGNILVKDKKFAAVIDFGCTSVGDPACDLVITYTFFKDKSRAIFMNQLGLDEDTWTRAKAWALWKACFELVNIQDKAGHKAIKKVKIINEILNQ